MLSGGTGGLLLNGKALALPLRDKLVGPHSSAGFLPRVTVFAVSAAPSPRKASSPTVVRIHPFYLPTGSCGT